MGSEVPRCPKCLAEINPGAAFCSECGMRFETQVVPPQANAARAEPEVALDNNESVSDSAASGWPFLLSAAIPVAMQVGRRSLVVVRFRTAADIYESVEFVLRNGDVELCRRPCCAGRPMSVEHKVFLDVTPRNCGVARVELDIICRIGPDGDEEVHTAALHIAVDDRAPSAFSPVINISQTQTSDRAGDTKGGDINVNLGGLKINADDSSARYETDSSRFVPLEPHLRISPARLTLSGDCDVLQLVSDKTVTFGRSRDNTIPLRIYGADGSVRREETKTSISRYHFRVECSDHVCAVMDGGMPPGSTAPAIPTPSSYGTRLDGSALPPAGSAVLVPGRDIALAVGRTDSELPMNLRFWRDSWGRPEGVLVERRDGARQKICIVWREIPLSGSVRILWNGSCWMLAEGSSAAVGISVGTTVSVGGNTFNVLPFHQTHIT